MFGNFFILILDTSAGLPGAKREQALTSSMPTSPGDPLHPRFLLSVNSAFATAAIIGRERILCTCKLILP